MGDGPSARLRDHCVGGVMVPIWYKERARTDRLSSKKGGDIKLL